MTSPCLATDPPDAGLSLPRVSGAIEALLAAEPGKGSLTATLAQLLQLDGVLLIELPPPGSSALVTVLEAWLNGGPAPIFQYALSGTPCDETVRRGWCVHPQGVAQAFPEDRELTELGIEGYAGRVLHDRSGVQRGLLVALSRSPLGDISVLQQTFTLFTPLALAELEHRLAQRERLGRAAVTGELIQRMGEGVAIFTLERPLPLEWSHDEQVDHLLQHARITEVNDALAHFVGRAPADMLGGGFDTLYGDEAAQILSRWVAARHELAPQRLQRATAADGLSHWDCIFVPSMEQNHLIRLWTMHRDVTAAEHHLQSVRHQALHDALTGLGNRAALYEQLRAVADLPAGTIALGVLDINHFHEINDQLGHSAGDETLQSIAGRLRRWAPAKVRSCCYRLAGDEFVVLCQVPPGHTDDWAPLFEDLVACLNEPMQVSGHALSLTLSVGVAVGPAAGDPVDTLLWRADLAKRLARERGRSVLLHTPADARSPRRRDLLLLADIRAAVTQQQFVLRYQPKVCPRRRVLVGLEALIRWPHPLTGREVPPGEFIPFIETTAYIHPVTQWVLDQALLDLASLSGHPQLSTAVNISAKNLLDERFVAKVVGALRRTGVAPHRLELELTESSFLSSPQFARQQIEALADLGVRVSIDDFGTGFSSLSYLQDLPVHAIKVDQIFVRPLLETPKSATIARVAVELAHALGMQAVAEGVENAALVEPLAAMGYDALQGFAIARPAPLHEALAAAQAWCQTSPLRIA